MGVGLIGWRPHVGVIFPTPIPLRAAFMEANRQGGSHTNCISTIDFLHDKSPGVETYVIVML